MLAHLTIRHGRFAWSGHNASGDASHRHALVVDVGRDFILTSEGNLYLIGPGPMRFTEFSPEGFALAARREMFGFKLLKDEEAASRQWDGRDQVRKTLGRRGRIASDLRE